MAVLALRYGHGPVLLREVAEQEAISEKYLGQIVIPLRSAALLRSVRGARGGYELAREPREITVREIVEVLEGGLDIADGEKEHESVRTLSALVIHRVWEELTEEIARSLSAVSLDDIAHRVREGGESPVMYNI